MRFLPAGSPVPLNLGPGWCKLRASLTGPRLCKRGGGACFLQGSHRVECSFSGSLISVLPEGLKCNHTVMVMNCVAQIQFAFFPTAHFNFQTPVLELPYKQKLNKQNSATLVFHCLRIAMSTLLSWEPSPLDYGRRDSGEL